MLIIYQYYSFGAQTSGFHNHNLIEYISGEEQNKYINKIQIIKHLQSTATSPPFPALKG